MENKCDIVEGGVVPWRSSLWGESVFRIGSGGMKPVETGKMPMTVGVRYPLGASSSPEVVLLTFVSKEKLRYKHQPWTASEPEVSVSRSIGEDLIYRGTRSYLQKGYKDDLSKSLRAMLRGGKGKKENLADFEEVTFLLTPSDKMASDAKLWGKAERYGTITSMRDRKTGRVYYSVQGTARDLRLAKKDKLFRIAKVLSGHKLMTIPESVSGDYDFSCLFGDGEGDEDTIGVSMLGLMHDELIGKRSGRVLGRWGEDGVFEETAIDQHSRLKRVKDEDIRKSSAVAAKKLESVFKKMSFDVSVLNTDGWGQTPMVVDMYGIRVPVHVGVQETPKHGVEVYVQFQKPSFVGVGNKWEKVSTAISAAMKKTMFRFSRFGHVTLPKNRDGWPTIWTRLDSDKTDDGVRAFASLVHELGVEISKSLSRIEEGIYCDRGESVGLDEGVELDDGIEGVSSAV